MQKMGIIFLMLFMMVSVARAVETEDNDLNIKVELVKNKGILNLKITDNSNEDIYGDQVRINYSLYVTCSSCKKPIKVTDGFSTTALRPTGAQTSLHKSVDELYEKIPGNKAGAQIYIDYILHQYISSSDIKSSNAAVSILD